MFFFATSISGMVSIMAVGLLDRQLLALSLIGLPVMMSATFVGELAFRHGSDSLHRQVSIASLGAIALLSAISALAEILQ